MDTSVLASPAVSASSFLKRSTILIALLTGFTTPALALEWDIKNLGNLGGDDQHSANIEHLAMGINNQGQVVGWSITPEREYRGELVSFMSAFVSAPNGGPLTNLANVITSPHGVEVPGAIEESSYATSINDSGVAVIRAGRWHGLQSTLTSAPPYTHAYPIGPDRGGFLTGEDINNAGQVAGYNATPGQAFISSADRTTYQNIEWEIGTNTYGTGVNESGQVSLHTLNEDAASFGRKAKDCGHSILHPAEG